MKYLALTALLLSVLLFTGCESRADLEARSAEIGSAIELLHRVKDDAEDPEVVAELQYLINRLRQEQEAVDNRLNSGNFLAASAGLAIGLLTGGAGTLCWRTLAARVGRKAIGRVS